MLKPSLLWIAVLVGISSQTLAQGTPPPYPSPTPAKKLSYSALTPDEREILDNGEIGTGAYVAGGVVGTLVGLGIGQAIQGRYMSTGLIMTLGEIASISMMVAGATQCVSNAVVDGLSGQTVNCNQTLLTVGYIGYVGLRIWEIIDVWATPPSINHRYENLKNHVDQTSTSFGIFPVVSKDNSLNGAGLAFQLHF